MESELRQILSKKQISFYQQERKILDIKKRPINFTGRFFIKQDYIGGLLVVSGGVVLVVSIGLTVSVVAGVLIVVESIAVLSEVSETLFVELHADVANIMDPATTRLKIVLFIR